MTTLMQTRLFQTHRYFELKTIFLDLPFTHLLLVISEENVLPLYYICKWLNVHVFSVKDYKIRNINRTPRLLHLQCYMVSRGR